MKNNKTFKITGKSFSFSLGVFFINFPQQKEKRPKIVFHIILLVVGLGEKNWKKGKS